MKPINLFFEKIFSPFKSYAHYLLRLTLGISFFLHGYNKLPINEGFINWLGSQNVLFPEIISYLIAWGEILSGIGIILSGLIVKILPDFSNLLTRLSGGVICVIMICALTIAHSDWGILFGERGKVLFASEQLFLLTLGLYFLLVGSKNE